MASVILDTNVFVAAGFNPGSAAARLIRAIREGEHRLVWDEATRGETERIVRKIPRLDWNDVADLFQEADRWDGPTDRNTFTMVADPEDRKFAALSAATGCPVVTNDDHLLSCGDDSGFTALTPSAFLTGA